MRLFIAVDLPDEHKRELGRLRSKIPGARWVPEEQIHLTLVFPGETDEETVLRLANELAQIQAEPFMLRVATIGCFPDRRRPRVVWAGVQPEPKLSRLAATVHKAVLATGISLEERPFSPHITLARLKLPPSPELCAFLDLHGKLTLKPFSVREFTLFQSLLTRDGAVHTPVRIYPLTCPPG